MRILRLSVGLGRSPIVWARGEVHGLYLLVGLHVGGLRSQVALLSLTWIEVVRALASYVVC